MTITLDIVFCLIHLLIRGDFWDAPLGINEEGDDALVIDLLGVTIEEDLQYVISCRGPHYILEWLHNLFEHHQGLDLFIYVARAYMFMLVGYTIFANKSFTLVEEKFPLLFRNLSSCGRYSWG